MTKLILTLNDARLKGQENKLLAVVTVNGKKQFSAINRITGKWTGKFFPIDEKIAKGRTLSEIVMVYNQMLAAKRK